MAVKYIMYARDLFQIRFPLITSYYQHSLLIMGHYLGTKLAKLQMQEGWLAVVHPTWVCLKHFC